ncbi:MAG: [protein-PII] uridylyltransferase, partial [Gammaproteobacteria bacterium]
MGHSDATSASTPISLSAPSFRAQLIDVIHHRQPVNELLMTVKTHLNTLSTTLITAFEQGTNVEDLLRYRATCIDTVLTLLWQTLVSHNLTAPATLVASGGYGRRELHLHSDIDLLFLFDNEFNLGNHSETLQHFVAFLWDTGLMVGHSVRTLEHCVEQARSDISIATNMMEARLLAGDGALFNQLRALTTNDAMLTDAFFFKAKLAEQLERHQKDGNTECNLEPNLKTAPGGLRDIQTIVWITRKHFGVRRLRELVQNQFLTPDEYHQLSAAQNVLWRIRYALHILTGRDENRLLFDYQKTLARMLGFQGTERNRAVEALMQWYYRNAMTVSELNEQLMQHFQEDILSKNQSQKITVLNDRFRVRDGLIEVIHDNIFKKFPSALLEIFVLLAQHQDIEGIRAATIRLIRSHGHLIDERFRADPQNHKLFMDLIRSPHRLFTQLRCMKRYGVLARYIPAFAHTIGQMQYDLFHIYTVDAHILYVVRNMRRFLKPELNQDFPLASQLAQATPKKEVLYLAALFHDMAKGRDGDHSELGAQDAEAFCATHGLPPNDCKLVAWLVRYHLLMS